MMPSAQANRTFIAVGLVLMVAAVAVGAFQLTYAQTVANPNTVDFMYTQTRGWPFTYYTSIWQGDVAGPASTTLDPMGLIFDLFLAAVVFIVAAVTLMFGLKRN